MSAIPVPPPTPTPNAPRVSDREWLLEMARYHRDQAHQLRAPSETRNEAADRNSIRHQVTAARYERLAAGVEKLERLTRERNEAARLSHEWRNTAERLQEAVAEGRGRSEELQRLDDLLASYRTAAQDEQRAHTELLESGKGVADVARASDRCGSLRDEIRALLFPSLRSASAPVAAGGACPEGAQGTQTGDRT